MGRPWRSLASLSSCIDDLSPTWRKTLSQKKKKKVKNDSGKETQGDLWPPHTHAKTQRTGASGMAVDFSLRTEGSQGAPGK